jgi:hypothetical protein
LGAARILGVEPILAAADVATGSRHLLLAFIATLFNELPALPPPPSSTPTAPAPEPAEQTASEGLELDSFRAWLRCLDLGAAVALQSPQLLVDLADGAVLVRALEAVAPGATSAEERRRADEALAATGAKATFARLAAGSAFVAAARRLGLSVPGLGGADIAGRNAKLVLGALWQVRRRHLVGLLQREGQRTVGDADVLAWANRAATWVAGGAAAARSDGDGPAVHAARDLRDASPKFLLHVLAGAFPDSVDLGLASANELDNARLALSLARRSGCSVFGVAEELVARNPRAIFAFLAAAMSCSSSLAASAPPLPEAAAAASSEAVVAAAASPPEEGTPSLASPPRPFGLASPPPGASPVARAASAALATSSSSSPPPPMTPPQSPPALPRRRLLQPSPAASELLPPTPPAPSVPAGAAVSIRERAAHYLKAATSSSAAL